MLSAKKIIKLNVCTSHSRSPWTVYWVPTLYNCCEVGKAIMRLRIGTINRNVYACACWNWIFWEPQIWVNQLIWFEVLECNGIQHALQYAAEWVVKWIFFFKKNIIIDPLMYRNNYIICDHRRHPFRLRAWPWLLLTWPCCPTDCGWPSPACTWPDSRANSAPACRCHRWSLRTTCTVVAVAGAVRTGRRVADAVAAAPVAVRKMTDRRLGSGTSWAASAGDVRQSSRALTPTWPAPTFWAVTVSFPSACTPTGRHPPPDPAWWQKTRVWWKAWSRPWPSSSACWRPPYRPSLWPSSPVCFSFHDLRTKQTGQVINPKYKVLPI